MAQCIPLHRVRMCLAFTVQNMQVLPLFGWQNVPEQWRLAMSKGAA